MWKPLENKAGKQFHAGTVKTENKTAAHCPANADIGMRHVCRPSRKRRAYGPSIYRKGAMHIISFENAQSICTLVLTVITIAKFAFEIAMYIRTVRKKK